MMIEPGEHDPSEEAARRDIETMLGSGDAGFVAERAGRLVGYVALERGRYRRNRHTAVIVLGVLRETWGQRVGTRLLGAAERWARSVGVHRLELTVMTTNERAAGLYRRRGFEVEGVKRHAMRVAGRFVDEWIMARLLGERDSGRL